MTNKAISKKLMLAGGILAALVILCSQALQKETRSFLAKIKTPRTEKSSEAEKKVAIAAPADAVTSGQSVEVAEANPSFIREIILDTDTTSNQPIVDKTILADFFKTLFRAVISPQAP